ncbi:aryl hydrocarbon receptor-like [Teleopsis dalmanni]|uniref:aryl hydrocarbon receptor-like n=1 Tax=Teleopsis dalmanni TaxID=139649 RepID=UPI0018CF63F8|nr:aryl hydrocarbon receptor-like [Teleopsis dalmanni]
MSQLGTVYATKRRRRNGKSLKPPPKDGVTKSNPSKRHRERLNAELDLLASLLPFEQNILSKLDRLSILRLSVSYLRTKSYFQFVMHKEKEENGLLPHIHAHDGYRTRELGAFEHGLLDGDMFLQFKLSLISNYNYIECIDPETVVMHKEKEENGLLPHIHAHDGYRTRELGAFEHGLLDGDMFLQALNGFLMILTCEGEVFFATHSIESYLGFHQSDIVHQSVYELVHSEDREELQRQLLWNSFLPADMSSMQLAETLAPDKSLYLERSFTVRFRCLLDNTSGFLRLDIRGRIKVLHGQNRKTEEPPLALFAYCTPFGPPSLLEIPHKENMFKSKHKLDFSLVSMDQSQQQQHQQQQQQLHLSYNNQLQPLTGCTSTTSSSSSPSCTSPTASQLPTTIIGNMLNGTNSNDINSSITPYQHQLAIIASPIVIASADGQTTIPLTTTLQPINANIDRTNRNNSHRSSHVLHANNAHNHHLLHTAAVYALGSEQQADGSPLLSFSEVTNTLLNQ